MSDEDRPFVGNASDAAMPALVQHWRQRQARAITGAHIESSAALYPPSISGAEAPDVVLQAALLYTGDETTEGRLIVGVAIPWFEIIRNVERDPTFMFSIHWRQLEELIAGAYQRAGWQVELTPRSGDGGRDIIATMPGVGAIRILD